MTAMRAVFFLLLLLFFLSLFPTASLADEYYTIINEVDPSLAKRIVLTLLETDLAECMAMARSFGELRDPNVSNIVSVLCDPLPRDMEIKAELVLRLILESVFPATAKPEELKRRVALNKEGLEVLGARIGIFSSPLLRGKILSLLPHVDAKKYNTLIMREGFVLISLLKLHEGILPPEPREELLGILSAIGVSAAPDFLELCIEIMRNAKDSEVYTIAKSLAERLLGG
jgi:hypothetical protein